jgi:hypothetical protein
MTVSTTVQKAEKLSYREPLGRWTLPGQRRLFVHIFAAGRKPVVDLIVLPSCSVHKGGLTRTKGLPESQSCCTDCSLSSRLPI